MTFGELSLLYNAPRAATVTAKSEKAVLWSLDRLSFSSIIKLSVQKRRDRFQNFLENVEIFKQLDLQERSRIADAFKEKWFKNGETIIAEGDQGQDFYMIVEGTAKAYKKCGNHDCKQYSYGPGDHFGERALLKDQPRAATVVTTSDLVLTVSLDRSAFKRLMGPLESILLKKEEEYNK